MKTTYRILLLLNLMLLGTAKMWAIQAYAVIDTQNDMMTFYYDNNRSLHESNSANIVCLIPMNGNQPGWKNADNHVYFLHVKDLVFDYSFAGARPNNTSGWFSAMEMLTTITGAGFLNTSEVTDMSNMFSRCHRLNSDLNLTGWDVSNVTDMSSMFEECQALTSLNLSGWNTANVTDMSNMFKDCNALTTLNVSSWNTANVTTMENMFYDCESITSLSVGSWNTVNVTNMNHLFYRCKSLTSLTLSRFNTSNVTDMSYMFNGCESLTSLNLSHFNTSNVTDMSYMFNGCESLTSLNLSHFNTSKVNNIYHMFYGCSSITSLDMSNVDTSNQTNLSGMFAGLSALQSLDLSSFNTGKVTDMSNMFIDCYNMKSIKFGSGWTNDVLTNVNSMFKNCSSLTTLTDFIYFKGTSNLTDMASMFEGCSKLKNIPFNANVDTRNVTDMSNMFKDCSSLITLNVNLWNTGNVSDMENMFSGCSSLTTLTGIANWKPEKVSDMDSMFESCSALTNLDLSGWKTSNLKYMSYMFSNCSSLVTLDLTGWDVSKVQYMTRTFANCSSLVTIYAGPGWTHNVDYYNGNDCFSNCYNLVGGNGTVWNQNGTNACFYANIDIPEDTGYLTKKVINYGLRVGGIEVTNWNASTITGSNIEGTVSFDPATLTLTIDGATITGDTSSGGIYTGNDYAFNDLTVKLVGANTLNDTGGFYALSFHNDVTISGPGSLSGVSCRVYNGKKLTVNGGCTLSGSSIYGDSKTETLVVGSNSTKVQLTGAIAGFANVTLQNGLLYSQPIGGSYDTTNCYLVDAYGNRATGVDIGNFADYGLTVANIRVTSQNASAITASDINGQVSFDPATRTLTLTNANISTSANTCISTTNYAFNDLTIRLLGNCSLTCTTSPISVLLSHNTTFTGGQLSTDYIRMDRGKELTIGGGCKVSTTCVEGVQGTERLVLRNAQTSLQVSDNIIGFASMTMYDGLHISTPANGSYNTTKHYVQNANGTRASGVTIDNNTDYNYGLYVIGTAVKTSNCSDVLGNGTVSYNADTSTLTLNNATLQSSSAEGIQVASNYAYSNLTIVLVGNNTINTQGNKAAMPIRSHTTITGTGTLTLANNGSIEILAAKNLVIEGGCTINAYEIDDEYSDGATLTVRGADTQINLTEGIFGFISDITLEDGLYFANPDRGHYDADNQYVVDRDWNQATNGVTISLAPPYVVFDSNNSTLTFYDDGLIAAHEGSTETVYYLNTGNSVPAWQSKGTSVLHAVFHPSFVKARPTSTYHWFYGMTNLTDIEGLHYLNTSNVTNMASMFYNCKLLTQLNVAGFDTQNVTSMYSMFSGCNALLSLDVSNFDTQNVTTMASMFNACRALQYLDMSGFNTSKVAGMDRMFNGCNVLESLDVSGFDTQNVTNMSGMFMGCRKVTYLDVSAFETGRVATMESMFSGCYALADLDLTNFNTENIGTMYSMFQNCYALTSLDLSSFNTANVTNMYTMFSGCNSLTTLDLSSFNTAKVTSMYGMFSGCSSLMTIFAGDWNTAAVQSSNDMFKDCDKLMGGKGTAHNSSHVNHQYAHIDGGTSNPGYFTDKATFLLGDVNQDTTTNIADITALVNIIRGNNAQGYNRKAADVNQDGNITPDDVTVLLNMILGH